MEISIRNVSKHDKVSQMITKASRAANQLPEEKRRQLLRVNGIMPKDAYCNIFETIATIELRISPFI